MASNAEPVRRHRGPVVARNGVVAASQPLAVSAGLHVLQQGGTFADAAIATSAVLCVVEPYASHLGGDAFGIVYDHSAGGPTALNGSGCAPLALEPERFAGGIPARGLASATVPGLVDFWFTLHARWGSLPVAQLLGPAIGYAEDGYPVSFRAARSYAANSPLLLRDYPETLASLANGRIPSAGDVVRQPDLARTLRAVADGGRDAFYDGEVAAMLVAASADQGGLFTREDFRRHCTQVSEPLSVRYRDHVVHGQPPVSQGVILMEELALIDGWDVGAMGQGSADAIHLQVEAKKAAFADRMAYLGEGADAPAAAAALLEPRFIAARRRSIDASKASNRMPAGAIEHDTTYFAVADRNGNAVSFIQSVFWGFGCGVVARGTGVLFNNRLCGFSLDPASPNLLAPGRRPMHTLNAWAATRSDGSLAYVGGTPGGDIQVQSNLQVISNLVDHGLDPQEAIELPRWQHGGAVGSPDEAAPEVLGIEERIAPETVAELRRRGHVVELIGPWDHGSACQVIAARPDGTYVAGSDPRCDGHAAGF